MHSTPNTVFVSHLEEVPIVRARRSKSTFFVYFVCNFSLQVFLCAYFPPSVWNLMSKYCVHTNMVQLFCMHFWLLTRLLLFSLSYYEFLLYINILHFCGVYSSEDMLLLLLLLLLSFAKFEMITSCIFCLRAFITAIFPVKAHYCRSLF